jgi:hypothetical protein
MKSKLLLVVDNDDEIWSQSKAFLRRFASETGKNGFTFTPDTLAAIAV